MVQLLAQTSVAGWIAAVGQTLVAFKTDATKGAGASGATKREPSYVFNGGFPSWTSWWAACRSGGPGCP